MSSPGNLPGFRETIIGLDNFIDIAVPKMKPLASIEIIASDSLKISLADILLTSSANTSGCCNIAIGYDVELSSASGNSQFAIGAGTNRWLTGDSNYVVSSGNALEAGTFFQNAVNLDTNTTFPASGTKNGGVFGPYTIDSGVTLTISSGSTFTII